MKCEKCGMEMPSTNVCPNCESDKKTEENIIDTENTENTEKVTPDDEFEKRYTSAFETPTDGEKYKIDEELKRKREARYDESFSNMTNDEKIQALEAARMARREKREKKKQQKKESGGVFSNILKHEMPKAISPKKPKAENASKATQDSERKEDNNIEDNNIEKTRVLNLDDVKRGLSSKKKNKKHLNTEKFKPKHGVVLGGVLAALAVVVIVASVSIASGKKSTEAEIPTVYTKGNMLYTHYDGSETMISTDFIESERDESIENAPDEIKEKDLILSTSDGSALYFIDSADMNAQSGTLNYIKGTKSRSLTKIADDVYYKTAISQSGDGILYLSGADSFGNGGSLNYWSAKTEKSVKLSDSVNADSFMLSQDGTRVLYVTNYNDEYFVGDLYMACLQKGEISEMGKLDSDVYKLFGTNALGTTAVYAKNYDKKSLCFDVYITKDTANGSVLVAEKSRCTPLIAKNSEYMYVGGSYENYYQSLYYASLENGQKEKIGGNLTELVKMSGDEQSVVYRKANAEGTAFDYFYASAQGENEQELAMNITVLDDADHKRVCQFDINDDFTKAIFIQGYDTECESGALFMASINSGVVSSDKKISDTAYSCNLTPSGIVRYADSYDTAWNLVNLNAYDGDNTYLLAKEVGAGAFTFDKAGKYIVYAKNYSLENKTGDVYCVDNKAKTNEVVKSVSTYGLKSNGDIVYSEKTGDSLDIFMTKPSGKGAKNIDKDATKVVSY